MADPAVEPVHDGYTLRFIGSDPEMAYDPETSVALRSGVGLVMKKDA